MSDICEKCQAKDSFIEDYAEGIIVCTNCGLVLEENIIADEYEKRTFESDNNEIKRVGPPTRPEQATESGTYLVIRENGHTQKRTIYSKQTKIFKNYKRIQNLLTSAEVFPNLIEKTKDEYKELAKIKNFQGRNLNHIIIALYYYVCRKEKMAKTFKDVANMFPSVTERQIKKAFNDIKSDVVDYDDEDELISMEKNFINMYIGRDESKYEAKMLSYKIIKNINNNAILEGKSPITVAGLSLILSYKLLNDNSDNFKDFFSTFVTKATLNRAFEHIKNNLDMVVPNEYMNKIEDLKKSMDSMF